MPLIAIVAFMIRVSISSTTSVLTKSPVPTIAPLASLAIAALASVALLEITIALLALILIIASFAFSHTGVFAQKLVKRLVDVVCCSSFLLHVDLYLRLTRLSEFDLFSKNKIIQSTDIFTY